MEPKIVLVTRLNSGISRSAELSGDVKTFRRTKSGIGCAFRALQTEIKTNVRCYGNVGAGRSWLELRDETGIVALPDGFWITENTTAASVIDTLAEIDAARAADLESAQSAFGYGMLLEPLPARLQQWHRDYDAGRALASENSGGQQ